MTIRVTVWNEFRNEREDKHVDAIYPEGMGRACLGNSPALEHTDR